MGMQGIQFMNRSAISHTGGVECFFSATYGGFHQWGYPKMLGLQGKILLKWMIWRYPYGSGNHHIPVLGRLNHVKALFLSVKAPFFSNADATPEDGVTTWSSKIAMDFFPVIGWFF